MINNFSLNVVQGEITEYKYKFCTDVCFYHWGHS